MTSYWTEKIRPQNLNNFLYCKLTISDYKTNWCRCLCTRIIRIKSTADKSLVVVECQPISLFTLFLQNLFASWHLEFTDSIRLHLSRNNFGYCIFSGSSQKINKKRSQDCGLIINHRNPRVGLKYVSTSHTEGPLPGPSESAVLTNQQLPAVKAVDILGNI